MTRTPTTPSRIGPAWIGTILSFAASVAFTATLAIGLTLFSKNPVGQDEPPGEPVVAVAVPEPPPPPPVAASTEGTPLPPAPLVFEAAASSSTVHLPPTPIPLEPLVPEARPNYALRFDFTPGQFKPQAAPSEPGAGHVFQPSEVDQRIVPLYRKIPEISVSLLKSVRNPRVRVLFVVNIDGSVQDVRVLHGTQPEFDRKVVEAIRQWRFRPAMRQGRKVRCIAELPVWVQAPSSNPFSAD